MATLTLATIRNLIRSDLNEATTTAITDTELNSIINDGYKDVSVKGMCYENKITLTDIPISIRMIPLSSYNIVRLNYVEYNLGASGCLGLLSVMPQTIGHIPINGYSPQYYFKWGNYLVIEPLPDVGTYDLFLYASCYPAAVMTADGDTPASLPIEFHESVYQYALAFSCLKLKRWGDAANFYNKYIENVQSKKFEYVSKYPDSRMMHELPATVTVGGQ